MDIKEAKRAGSIVYKRVKKLDPRFAEWSIFSKTLGFFQWKRAHKLTDEQVKAFQEGFEQEKCRCESHT